LMDDYLHDEIQYVTLASEKHINKWVCNVDWRIPQKDSVYWLIAVLQKATAAGLQSNAANPISNQTRESFKRCVVFA
jgi:hypothetical protein